jgi:nitrate/nitrite transporter NarK
MTAIPLAGVIGGPISGWILARAGALSGLRGWQWLYLLEAVPSVIAGLVTMFFLSDGPAKARWLNEQERALLTTRLEEDEASRHGVSRSHHSVYDAFRSGKTWLLAAVYFGYVMGNYGLSFFLPQIVKDTLTQNPLQIGWLTAIPYALSAVAMVLVGHSSDKTGERRWHVGLTGLLAAVAFTFAAFPHISGVIGFAALTLATASNACAYSTFWALPTSILSGVAASAGIAWINSLGNLAGFLGPYAMGGIRDNLHSNTPALLFIAAFVYGSALITIYFFKPKPKTLPTE